MRRNSRLANGFCVLGAVLVLVSASPLRAELLSNGTFDANIDGWIDPTAYQDTALAWSYYDPHEDPASGSLMVTTNLPEAWLDGPWQCVLTARGPHSMNATMLRDYPLQHIEPYVSMTLDFFASEDCTGAPLAGSVDDVAINGDVWEPLAAQTEAPADTHSARVRFWVGGTYDTWADTVFFDDVSLVPEPGAAALAFAALVALQVVATRGR